MPIRNTIATTEPVTGIAAQKALSIPMLIKRAKPGFKRHSIILHWKSACLPTDMQHKKARNSSLTRNPHKYPRIPKTGTAKSTKARRIPIATMFCKNVVPVFPRPFYKLPMVVARNIKGHSQHKTVIIDPESSLRKIIVPSLYPNLVKIPMHKIPI